MLHVGSIAGVPQELSNAQRKLGLKSDVLSFDCNPFGYRVDMHCPIKLDYSSKLSLYFWNPLRLRKKMPLLLRLMNQYDVLHFHYSSALPLGFDFPIWQLLNKMVIIHHHGTDVRQKGERLMYSKFADGIFASTPDLLEWSKNATWVPNPIDLERYSYVGVDNSPDVVKIVHAPSNRALKGTKYVLDAIETLKREGHKIEFVLIENFSREMAIKCYKWADIVVDQLMIGWYGMLAQECMALGKPVCVYIRDDIKRHMPFNPICNTSPENIVDNLRMLIRNPDLRAEIGDLGRRYVEQVHDSERVARIVTDLY